MVKAAEYFVVGKGKEWLMTSQSAVWESTPAHIWSIYLYDAELIDNAEEAWRIAEITGGAVFRFVPATGKVEREAVRMQENICDTFRWYALHDGTCKNGVSPFYREYVCCFKDCCDEWRGKRGRKGHCDSAADEGDWEVEEPGGGSGGAGLPGMRTDGRGL